MRTVIDQIKEDVIEGKYQSIKINFYAIKKKL